MKDETSSFPVASSTFNYQPGRLPPRDCLRALATPVRFLKGIGPKRAAQLETLNLRTVEDLLYHLPFRYEDRRQILKIGQATVGKEQTFIGTLVALEKRFVLKRRRQILVGALADETGNLGLLWYRATPYILKELSKGQELMVHGKVEWGVGTEKRIVHPDFEPVDPGDAETKERILPIYLRPGGIPMGAMRRWVAQALADYGGYLPRCIPESIARRQGLMDLGSAMDAVHRPARDADISSLNNFASQAHRSIIFDEFLCLQLGLRLRRKFLASSKGISFLPGEEGLTKKMRTLLPFNLTGAQARVLSEIYGDMESSRPMQRLVQGDVGCGKTIVAWFAALRAIENGMQAVWMAPTELLAEQHYQNLNAYAEALRIPAALLTGSVPLRSKKEMIGRIENGAISFIVGTHALIQEGVRIPRMGLGIIDEQHRFGVLQRMALQRLCNDPKRSTLSLREPDMLLMSATPIPRSLAMVLYGDMEVSSVDEMPPGRRPVLTKLFSAKQRGLLYRVVCQEARKGNQAYVVYPLVEASERINLRDATRMAGELSQGAFKEFSVGLLHGRMSAEEKQSVMRRFKEGELRILVATTVIEVGIDIPNATLMVIEHAERFGLSQLHQLRGRVGRGEQPSQCLLVHYGANGQDALRRLLVMEREHDGFKIAEADLKLRGPGELLGTRQAGFPDFRLANLVRDSQLLLAARQEAMEWLARDPSLDGPDSLAFKEILKHRWGAKLELGSIG